MKTKKYTVTIDHKEETIFQKKFHTLYAAERYAFKTIREILVCETLATITDNTTGEIMALISR